MDEPYDLLNSLTKTKADELMIGFAGFLKRDRISGLDLEGIVKVSAFCRADGSGYLTLTYIMDHESDASGDLGKPTESALRDLLGSNFMMLIDIPLNAFAAKSPYLIQEMDIYFHNLQGQERRLIEASVFPALSQLLSLRFEPLQIWEEGTSAGGPPKSISLFKRLFGRP